MPFIEWSNRLSVNIPSIDRQHKVLIGHINKLEEAMAKGNAALVLEFILNGLATYTQVHFIYEEMLFDVYTYPETSNHNMAHEKLLKRVGEYKTRFESGDTGIGPELLDFLKAWLNKHILKEDMAYSDYLVAKGVK